ncbi:hypothetical protein JAAARDRAFT_81071, partial [Jaapia argillacea MUCL 33604]
MVDPADPLSGFVRRSVDSNQVENVISGDANPFTRQPHSDKYRRILEGRRRLPVYAQMDEFYQLFNQNPIIIVGAEPGSGKTTQIPQFVCYSDLPHKSGKMVACTQPRRLGTTSAARRVADEMDVTLGNHVGYSIRFEDKTDPQTTFLMYMTNGLLLRELMNDPTLSRYSTIIFDEAHERTLEADLLMACLKPVVKERTDLKLVIMFATQEALKFQKFFAPAPRQPAPLFKVLGRAHPVDVIYTQRPEPDYVRAAIIVVLRIQQRIYDPHPPPHYPTGPPGRKVIVATDIAETSLTIDGIVYVVDPGISKQRVNNPRIRVDSLLVSPISKASAQQRAGRAGRTSHGKCFRLYTKRDFKKESQEQTHPEILRSNLATTMAKVLIVSPEFKYSSEMLSIALMLSDDQNNRQTKYKVGFWKDVLNVEREERNPECGSHFIHISHAIIWAAQTPYGDITFFSAIYCIWVASQVKPNSIITVSHVAAVALDNELCSPVNAANNVVTFLTVDPRTSHQQPDERPSLTPGNIGYGKPEQGYSIQNNLDVKTNLATR